MAVHQIVGAIPADPNWPATMPPDGSQRHWLLPQRCPSRSCLGSRFPITRFDELPRSAAPTTHCAGSTSCCPNLLRPRGYRRRSINKKSYPTEYQTCFRVRPDHGVIGFKVYPALFFAGRLRHGISHFTCLSSVKSHFNTVFNTVFT